MELLKVRPKLNSVLKSVCEDQQINDFVITNVETNEKGEGYLGDIYMISVKNNKDGRQLNILIKVAITAGKARDLAPVGACFKNEFIFYQYIMPTFKNLEKLHGVTQYNEIIPQYLKVNEEEGQEMLVLENLKSMGFKVFDKKSVLDHDHIELIFKTYGRFHAYSYALRDQNLEEYSKLVENFTNIFGDFMSEGFFGDHLVNIIDMVRKSLVPGEDDTIIEEFKKYEGENVKDIFRSLATENCDYAAIIHGDSWSNNMLFRYEETENKPCEMRLIDWQLIKTGSPVCDLSYCLYSGTTKEVYGNIDNYLKIYYESFSSFLKQLGGNPEKLFPFTALKEHWKKYAKFGMIMAFNAVRMKLTFKDEIADFQDGLDKEELLSAIKNARCDEEQFRKRVKELVWHMYEIDAL